MNSWSIRMSRATLPTLQTYSNKAIVRLDAQQSYFFPDGSITIQSACGQRKIINKDVHIVEQIQVTQPV